MRKKVILLELNEINFDAVSFYIKRGKCLPGFKKLIEQGIVETEAEPEYENLEPWVQWPSVHTGKTLMNTRCLDLVISLIRLMSSFLKRLKKQVSLLVL